MTFTPSLVAKLVAEEVMAGNPMARVFGAAESAGYDLADVLDVLAAPFDHLAERQGAEVEEAALYGTDVIYELVEHAGMDAAAEIASRSRAFAEVDVRSHYTSFKARLRAQAAIVDEDPLASTYGLIADGDVSHEDRRWLLERMARVYPVNEFGQIAGHVAQGDASIIGEVLRKHQSPLEALETLLGELAPETMLVVLERFWDVARQPGDSRTALVRAYAALSRAEFRPLNRPLSDAASRGEPDWWLPLLREHGLKGAQAALHLLESGTDRLTIATQLSDGGYADEDVLTALLENGIGTRTSLSTLRDSGWHLDEMVKTLADRGELAPEVRGHLEDLGVPRSAQRQVLLEHWPELVVDLVLDPPGATPALPRASDPD